MILIGDGYYTLAEYLSCSPHQTVWLLLLLSLSQTLEIQRCLHAQALEIQTVSRGLAGIAFAVSAARTRNNSLSVA